MIPLVNDLIRALRHQERTRTGYRLLRSTGRYYDAYHWAWRRDVAWASADERRRTLDAWFRLRERHHVAWVERGGFR